MDLIKQIKTNRLPITINRLLSILDNDTGKCEFSDGSYTLYNLDETISPYPINIFRIGNNTILPFYNNIVMFYSTEDNYFTINSKSGFLYEQIITAIKNSKYSNYEIM